MDKIDLKQTLKHLYSPSAKEAAIVDVPPMSFLMIDGQGDPNTSETFQEAIGALYAVSYTLKFRLKKQGSPLDYTVMPLEGLWWVEDLDAFSFERRDDWRWTLMIAQPEHITAALVADALEEARRKKDLPSLARLRFEDFHEGLCVQIMHLGPYADEPATIAPLHDFAENSGHRLRGKHHEIYLGDPRRTAPEKLKTVLRHPVE